jgi:nucleotide-binding universal stress UspA family protein
MKLDTILVPLDGSTLAESALPVAVDLARTADAHVILLRAAVAHTYPGHDPVEAQLSVVREADTYLADVAARMRALGARNVTCSSWYGEAASAIIEAAAFNHADLIVMTTHGRTGLGRLVMGSVAESVLRGTTTPILVLRETGASVHVPAGAATPCPR